MPPKRVIWKVLVMLRLYQMRFYQALQIKASCSLPKLRAWKSSTVLFPRLVKMQQGFPLNNPTSTNISYISHRMLHPTNFTFSKLFRKNWRRSMRLQLAEQRLSLRPLARSLSMAKSTKSATQKNAARFLLHSITVYVPSSRVMRRISLAGQSECNLIFKGVYCSICCGVSARKRAGTCSNSHQQLARKDLSRTQMQER